METNELKMEPLLQLNGIFKAYHKAPVIQDLNLIVDPGEILGVMGPSGCGKSTLLRLIAGLESPDQGEIQLNGELLSTSNKMVPPHRRKMSMVFQSLALWPHLTVYQHLAYGLSRHNISLKSQIQEIAGFLQLDSLLHRYPEQLSGGEKQRVALGRALIIKPLILLCDEPFNSLDRALRKEIRKFFYGVLRQEKVTTIFVSHDSQDLDSVNRMFFMEKNCS